MIIVTEKKTNRVLRIIEEKVPKGTDIFSILYKYQVEVHHKPRPHVEVNDFHIGTDQYIKQTTSTYKLRDVILNLDNKSKYSVGHLYNMSPGTRIGLIQLVQDIHEREDKQ